MKRLIKKSRNSWDYYRIFMVIFMTISALSLWFCTSTYYSKEAAKQQTLIMRASHLEREVASTFDYVNNLMLFLGERIAKYRIENNYPEISALLKSELLTDQKMKEQYSWAMFDWATPDSQMVVNTRIGVMPTPQDLSKRYYAQMAPIEPWKMFFDSPDMGISSGEWIIPAGMGIARDGRLLGMISMGFHVSRLTTQLERSGELQHVGFIVLDTNHRIVLHSSHNKSDEVKEKLFHQFFNKLPKASEGVIPAPIKIGNMTYSYYQKMRDYPFIIITGYNNIIASEDFRETVMPILVEAALIVIVVAIALIFKYLTVKPISSLSQLVEAMREGKNVAFIRSHGSHEVRQLMLELLKLYRAQMKERRKKEHLTATVNLIEISDKANEDFLRDMHRNFDASIEAIKNGAYIAKEGLLGGDIKSYKKYFEAIYEVAAQMKSHTTDVVEYKHVDIHEAIEKCVAIKNKLALKKQVELSVTFQEDLPPIWIDRLRFQQIVLSVLFQSISYTLSGQHVDISITTENRIDGAPAFLVIKIKDNGLGMSEKERLEFEEQHKSRRYVDHDMTKLDIASIRHLISLHKGNFDMQTQYGEGSIFIIKLPYLSDDMVMESKEGMVDELLALEEMIIEQEKKKMPPHNVVAFYHPDHPPLT